VTLAETHIFFWGGGEKGFFFKKKERERDRESCFTHTKKMEQFPFFS
jgi:hypothetical protein